MSIVLPFLLEFLEGFILLHLHWGVLAGLSVLAHRKLKLPDELFRKMLHLAAVFAIMPIVLPISSWIVSVALCLAFAAEAYLGVKFSGLKQDLDMRERSDGEQQRSMLLLFATYAIIIALGWGFFGQKWIVVLSVIAWGVGDAFAALIGKRFGRHKIQGRHVEGKKSVEGSLAMFATSFLATFALYQGHTALSSLWIVALVSFWVALFACVAELFSRDGYDTVICPLSAMMVLVVLVSFVGVI